jgi:aminomethyltransferase
MTTNLLRTPLHDWHVANGGRMVDFAGWSMPVQYTSIAEEHKATRNAVGVFDISHMGRLRFFGTDVAKSLDSLVTRRVLDMKPQQIRYALICNKEGGILDDVLVYAGTPSEPDAFSMVVNASNRKKIIDQVAHHEPFWIEGWFKEQNLRFDDITFDTTMIAVQGPSAVNLVQQVADVTTPITSMRYYTYVSGKYHGAEILISRTGYTGEDGVEIICDAEIGPDIWYQLIQNALRVGGLACGLGARDTLRLEAAMPLYGHELSEDINPIQAGLNFAVNLTGREFIGRDAIERFAADKLQPVRVGLQVEGKRVPRQGCPVFQGDEIVGEVTSGTFSPTFERSIAMAYVRPSAQAIGTHLAVDIRGTQPPAVVVPLPFYKRPKEI